MNRKRAGFFNSVEMLAATLQKPGRLSQVGIPSRLHCEGSHTGVPRLQRQGSSRKDCNLGDEKILPHGEEGALATEHFGLPTPSL